MIDGRAKPLFAAEVLFPGQIGVAKTSKERSAEELPFLVKTPSLLKTPPLTEFLKLCGLQPYSVI